jgi:lipopolysaccharide transport system permease protein
VSATTGPAEAPAGGGSRLYLLRTQIRYELQSRFLGSVAGVYWGLINPMLQVSIYMFVVLVAFGAPVSVAGGDKVQYLLFLLAGLSAWFSMQEGLLASTTSLTRHSEIVKNVVFPLELLPIAAVISGMLSLFAMLGVLVTLTLATGHSFGISLVCFPLVFAVMFAFTLGLGMFCALINIVLRDFGYILPVLLQMGLLMTPVLYTIDDVPGIVQTISEVNPFYQIVAAFQAIFFDEKFPDPVGLGYAAVVAVLLLVAGLAMFRKAKGIAEALV